MRHSKILWFSRGVIVASLLPLPAYAQSTNPGVALAPFLIALGIAYVTRRMSIGGWLFYYYLNLYGFALFVMLISAVIISNLQPINWEDKALYTLYLLSFVPPLLVKALEVIFATRLLVKSQRNENNVKVVRYILLASVLTGAASVAIDSYHFREDLPQSIFALSFSSIWCLYFFLSYRVKCVLSRWAGEWNYDSFKGR